jgi:soluble lytic murein transglycosylase-like protein
MPSSESVLRGGPQGRHVCYPSSLMRITAWVLGALLMAGAAEAEVRFVINRDGSKVIYNVGRPSGRGADLNWYASKHDRRSRFDPIIERYAQQYGVSATLIRAVIQVESDFNPAVVSNKGARGLMQLMPATARRFGVTEVHDPEQNIHGGVQYLAYLQRLFNGDMSRVLAGYNAGENAVIRHGGIPPYAETTEYVRRAMTVYYGRPYGRGAIVFAGRRDGAKLSGGFHEAAPVAALIPSATYLGSH